VGPRACMDAVAEKGIISPSLPVSNPGRPALSLVATPKELS